MALGAKVGGTWKMPNRVSVKVSGTWRGVQQIYTRVGEYGAPYGPLYRLCGKVPYGAAIHMWPNNRTM